MCTHLSGQFVWPLTLSACLPVSLRKLVVGSPLVSHFDFNLIASPFFFLDSAHLENLD